MIRVATYNIKHASLKGLGAIADVLREIDADLVGLQEVDVGVRRSFGENQPRAIAHRLGWNHAFGAAFPYEGGEYGVALLSRHPVRLLEVVPLPSAGELPGPAGAEPRTLLRCSVELPSGPVEVAVTHLGLDPSERYAQARAVLEKLGERERVLLLGDFNEGHTEAAFGLLAGALVDCASEAGPVPIRTYPSDTPVIGIDHVFRGHGLPAARWARVVPSLASDHLPLVVELGSLGS